MSGGSAGVEQSERGLGYQRIRGLVTLVAGIALVFAVVFTLTAGAGAIWHKVTATPPVAATSATPASASGAGTHVVQFKLEVNPLPLGGVKGPDGLVHDAFVPGNFSMTVGTTYDVTIYNYDTQ